MVGAVISHIILTSDCQLIGALCQDDLGSNLRIAAAILQLGMRYKLSHSVHNIRLRIAPQFRPSRLVSYMGGE